MVQTPTRQSDVTPGSARSAYWLVVTKFVAAWLLSLVALFAIALLLNIDWARPKVEEVMSSNLKRTVRFGPLSWHLSRSGLAIFSRQMSIREATGAPFLEAGHSEIGIAFIPLVQGRLIIHHLSLEKPELWAVRLAPQRWNFSDLLESNPDVRFIQVEHGLVHVSDLTSPSSGEHRLVNLDMKLTWPRKDRRWPFYLSFDLPRDGYTSHIALTTVGTGTVDAWQSNKYKVDLTAENINPADLGSLRDRLPPFAGLVSLRLAADGTLRNGIKAASKVTVSNFSLTAPQAGRLTVGKLKANGEFMVWPDRIEWSGLSLDAGGVGLSSQGEIRNWQQTAPSIRATLAGRLADGPGGQQIAFASQDNQPVGQILEKVVAWMRTGSGFADVKVGLTGRGAQPSLEAEIRASGISARTLMEEGPLKDVSLLRFFGIDSQSKVNGNVRIDNNQRFTFSDIEIAGGASTIKASGFWDRASGRSSIKVASGGLDLAHMKSTLEQSAAKLPTAKSMAFSGRIDLAGSVDGSPDGLAIDLGGNLAGVKIVLKDRTSAVTGLTGNVRFDGKSVRLDKIRGKIGDGDFTLSGSVASGADKRLSLDFHATRLDLDKLDRIMEVLHIDYPVLAQHRLYGKVKEFSLKISGTANHPVIELSGVPDDLYYQPPGLAKPLRAVSGSFSFARDELILKDVGLVSRGSKIVTNLAIDKLSTTARLRRLKVKSTGIELADVNYYLTSTVMPEALRRGYLQFLDRYQLGSIRGRAYGDMLWQAREDGDFDFDGVIGFFNAGLKAGAHGVPVERISGILAASGKELLIQDITGNIGQTQFVMDGHITNYRSAHAVWDTDLRARLYPGELLKIVPGLARDLNFKLISSGPLGIKAQVNGTPEASLVVFTLRADEKDNLHINTQFGSLYQPKGKSIMLDGSLRLARGVINLADSHLLIGDSLLQAKGIYKWDSKGEVTLSGTLVSPKPFAASTLIAIADPTIKQAGLTGSVGLALAADGPLKSLSGRGRIDLDDISIPSMNISHLSGRIESSEFFIPAPGRGEPTDKVSRAKLFLNSVTVSDLKVDAVAADVYFQDNQPGKSRVGLTHGSARVAGGVVLLESWLDLSDHSAHLEAQLKKVNAAEIVDRLLSQTGELTGLADANIVLDSRGTEYDELIRNLSGSGHITVSAGKVARFGKLQERLTQANLLHQGIFGFNLNNLLQSVVPVRTGEFKDLTSRVEINKGLISFDELKFSGEDMRLRAAGAINLPLNTIELSVAGNLPRVSSSLIGGPVGEVSRELTIQKFLHLITFHALEDLPSLPILGDIASDRPRSFTFQVTSTLDKPDNLARSIEKTFRWLPNHANATAHPVPGMN